MSIFMFGQIPIDLRIVESVSKQVVILEEFLCDLSGMHWLSHVVSL